MVTSRTERPPESAGTSFLVKLYGDLAKASDALLSCAEFQKVIGNSAAARIIRWTMESRSLLFVGCSLEGLVADLAAIGAPAKVERKHFALCAVSNSNWNAQAAELKRLYGIEVLACDAEHISSALPEFLEDLVRQIEQPQPASAHSVAAT